MSVYTELGRVDTTDTNRKEFAATSLRPVDKASFGEFRWILSVSPVNEKGGGENTAFQELGVTFGNETTVYPRNLRWHAVASRA